MPVERTQLYKTKCYDDKIIVEVNEITFEGGGTKREVEISQPYKWKGDWTKGRKYDLEAASAIAECLMEISGRYEIDTGKKLEPKVVEDSDEIPF